MSGANPNSPGNGNPSANSPYYDSTNINQVNFNPTMAVLIIVLIGGCFAVAFVATVVRRYVRSNDPAASSPAQSRNISSKQRGLDKEVVDALPLIHCKDLGEKDDRECPVCLTEFEPEDNLRLLPACKHVFHQECIDAWFDSHSTCPLCRASLLDQTGVVQSMSGDQVALREPVETITEVSEHGDSDNDSQRVSNVSPLEDQSANVGPISGALTSREDERNSARGTLSRNSHSFKRAARGIEAYEKGAALPVSTSSKNASFRKPPMAPSSNPSIRRSSSLGSDLIALRKLLMGGAGTRESPVSYRLNATRSAVPKSDAPSGSWFRRSRSMNLGVLTRELSGEQWVTIDLETGKTAVAGPSSSKGESSKAQIASSATPERAWSDRFSLASIRGALSRTTSDISSRTPHLPV